VSAPTAWTLLVATAALHLGFQLTVSALVYPALGDTHSAFEASHVRHSRRIAPLVGVVYAALLAGTGCVVTATSGGLRWVAVALTLAVLALTGLGAVPLHRRLAHGFDVPTFRRLQVVDALRTLAAGWLLAVAAFELLT